MNDHEPLVDKWYFLTAGDLQLGIQYGHPTPFEVIQAYKRDKVAYVYQINLVCLMAGGKECYAGNAAFMATLGGVHRQTFAPTQAAATSFALNLDSPDSPNMLDIPLLKCRPAYGRPADIRTEYGMRLSPADRWVPLTSSRRATVIRS